MIEFTSKKIFNKMQDNLIISNSILTDNFMLSDYIKDEVNFQIQIVNSILLDFDISFNTFNHKVKIENTKINTLFGMSCFFISGLELIGCEIFGDTDLSCGGHNKNGATFLIKNCIFNGTVTFFDNWFQDFVIIEDNDFKKGTDIFYFGHKSTIVTFDNGYSIKNNRGDLAKKIYQ